MFIDSDQTARALEWLEQARPKWRLQTMQTSTRYDLKTGEYKRLPTKIRRFLNGTPVGMIAQVLQMLREAAPYKSPVFNLECGDEVYYPTSTYINKDGNPNTTNGRDATYTIVQDLRIKDDVSDSLGAGDESMCSSVSTAEYHWDESEVESLPDGEQGVVWQISGVSRDPESGLISYSVRKKQAITQHMPETTSKSTIRGTVSVETWDNLYGVPGDFKSDPVKGGSAPVRIPEAHTLSGGSVEVNVSENPDCTYKVQVVRTKAPETGMEQMYSVLRNQFQIQTTERTVGNKAGLQKTGIEYGDGVVTKYTSELADDGTWTNTTDVDTERAVSSSVMSVRVTPRGTITSWTDANMTDADAAVPGTYGEYKVTKTPGGRFTKEFTSYTVAQTASGASCEKTLFAHLHERVDGAAGVPEDSSHVEDAGGGKTVSVRYAMDDAGFVTKTTRTNQELKVENAVSGESTNAVSTSSTVVHRGLTAAEAAAKAGSPAIGKSVRTTKTNGDLRDVEITTTTTKANVSLGKDCSETAFDHTETTTSTVDGIPKEPWHTEFTLGDGKTTKTSYTVDASTGGVTKRVDVNSEKKAVGYATEYRVTSRSTVTTTRSRNVDSPISAAGLSVGTTASSEMTPGGKYNTSLTTSAANPGDIAHSEDKNKFSTTESNTAAKEIPTENSSSGGSEGKIVRVDRRLGDDGLWDETVSTTQESSVPRSKWSTRTTPRGTFSTHTDTQVASYTEPSGVGTGYQVETTPGGLYNVTYTDAPVPTTGDIGAECGNTRFQHTHTTVKTSKSSDPTETDSVSDGTGKTFERRATLGEDGLWDIRDTVVEEIEAQCTSTEYQDAFGSKTDTRIDNTKDGSPSGGKKYTAGSLIQSITRQKTPGGLENIVLTQETPVQVDTGLYEIDAGMDNGQHVYYVGITFRNVPKVKLNEYTNLVKEKFDGMNFGNGINASAHPSISVSPNRFGLVDGTVALTINATPKAFGAGGSGSADNWSNEYTVITVSYSPVTVKEKSGNDTTTRVKGLIRTKVTETHSTGGGVGREYITAILSGTLLKGSTFSYHHAGQAFSYDVITSLTTSVDYIDGNTDEI